MNNTITIDGTNDDIWNYNGAKMSFIITILSTVKFDLELNSTCIITLPDYAGANHTNNIIDSVKYLINNFDENFTVNAIGNIIHLTRVGNNESYKPEEFQ